MGQLLTLTMITVVDELGLCGERGSIDTWLVFEEVERL